MCVCTGKIGGSRAKISTFAGIRIVLAVLKRPDYHCGASFVTYFCVLRVMLLGLHILRCYLCFSVSEENILWACPYACLSRVFHVAPAEVAP
jgi:hypothetical protein